MSIGPAKIKIDLKKTVPDKMTVQGLKEQLDSIGLNCEDAAPEKLEEYIQEVRQKMFKGKVESFDILKTSPSFRSTRVANSWESGIFSDYVKAAQGNWTDEGSFPGRSQLTYIAVEKHFDWLDANRGEFPGIKRVEPTQSGSNPTVDIIKDKFVQISVTASSVVVEGVRESDVEAAMSNAIAPLTDSHLDNYHSTDSRNIFLAKNFDGENCDGVGILSIWWELFIKDYKKKDKHSPDRRYTLNVKAWSALYNSLADLEADYLAAKKQFPNSRLVE